MIDAFGWTWEYIDEEMTLPRYEAICDHWQRVPPVAVSASAIAQYLGAIKLDPAPKRKAEPAKEQDMAALFEMFGASGFSTSKPDWLRNG